MTNKEEALQTATANIGFGPHALREKPWQRAALWLCFLGPFFFITYGFANAHTAALPFVGHAAFTWESRIPFMPWMIIPYWSIDVFYGVSLFLWTSRSQLDRHAMRLIAATGICVTGFLLFPLQCSFERPEINQPFFRLLFELLESFDKPYNQAPSLHICLLIIIWDAFRRAVPTRFLWLLHGWAGLIAVSVFTTYQHHIIDGITAVPAALLCCYLFPLYGPLPLTIFKKKQRLWLPGEAGRAKKLARRYAKTACLLAGAAVLGMALSSGWQGALTVSILLWPALCFALMAAGYHRFGPAIFQKTPGMGPQAGQRPFASRIILAPYEYVAKIYRRRYTRVLSPAAEVVPGVWIGAFPKALPTPGCGVLDLTAEYVRPHVCRGNAAAYAAVPILDLLPPNEQELEDALHCLKALRTQGPVLVNCALGMTRSALVVACTLVCEGLCRDIEEALQRVRAVRPCIVVSESTAAAAHAFVIKRNAPHA